MARAGNLFEGSRPTLDFIAHGFSAGLAEMDAHLVGGLADFLYQRGGVLRRSGRSGVCGLHGTDFFLALAPKAIHCKRYFMSRALGDVLNLPRFTGGDHQMRCDFLVYL